MESRSTAERSTASSRARASSPSMEVVSAIFSYIRRLKPSARTREEVGVLALCGGGGGGGAGEEEVCRAGIDGAWGFGCSREALLMSPSRQVGHVEDLFLTQPSSALGLSSESFVKTLKTFEGN